jgi:hypothetical protein
MEQIGAVRLPAAFPGKYRVQGAQNVGRGIDERAVEVENEGRRMIHEGLLHA